MVPFASLCCIVLDCQKWQTHTPHTRTCVIRTHVRRHIHTYIHTYIRMHTHMHTHDAQTYIRTHTHTHAPHTHTRDTQGTHTGHTHTHKGNTHTRAIPFLQARVYLFCIPSFSKSSNSFTLVKKLSHPWNLIMASSTAKFCVGL